MPSTFRQSWLRSLAISGRHIETYLSTYFSPNTHLLGEAVALFFIGTLCPEIPSSRRWQQRGWKIVRQEAARQVRADGLHFEQSTYYHVYALDFFLHSAILASLNQIDVPKEYDRTLERMLDIVAALARAGIAPALGDDDGGRLFDPSRNQCEYLTDPLATEPYCLAAVTSNSPPVVRARRHFGCSVNQASMSFSGFRRATTRKSSAAFRTSGLYLMSGENRKWQLVIDAGPQGAHTAGHGHADAFSLTLACRGPRVADGFRNISVRRRRLGPRPIPRNSGSQYPHDRMKGSVGTKRTLRMGASHQAKAEGWISGTKLRSVRRKSRWLCATA